MLLIFFSKALVHVSQGLASLAPYVAGICFRRVELGINLGSIKGVGEQRPAHHSGRSQLIERLSVPPPGGLTQGAVRGGGGEDQRDAEG